MNRRAAVVCAFLIPMTIWGCSRNPSAGTTADMARLQEEVKKLAADREQLRKELKTGITEKDALAHEVGRLRPVVAERDHLRKELAACASERDTNLTNLDELKKGLKSLVDRAEAMAPSGSQTPVSAVTPPTPPAQ